MVFEWQNSHTTRCLWRPLGARETGIFLPGVLGAPSTMPTLETLQLVVTWQHCWHGNDVEVLILCMDWGQRIYGDLSIALLQKRRVYLLGTRKNFLYLLFYIPEMTNLTMLFNVLLATFTVFFFFMTSGHASNNPFQVVYLFSNKIFSLPQFENCLLSY